MTVSVEGIPDLTFLTVDGQEALRLRVGDRVAVRRSEHSVKASVQELGAKHGFFDVLALQTELGISERYDQCMTAHIPSIVVLDLWEGSLDRDL